MSRAAIIAFCALTGAIATAADKQRAPTIKDIGARPVEVRREARVAGSAERAMQNYRKFLELRNADPALRAEALRRLGDLNLESGELERMEKEVTQLDIAGAEAIRLYTTLLKAYPDYPRNDEVLYQLARAYETSGQTQTALSTLEQIIRRYPQAPLLDEVHFRRAEILFSDKRYDEAQRGYENVIRRGATGRFYDRALYKHGWALFKQSLNQESLPSFNGVLDANLLDRRDRSKVVPLESLSRADRELIDDTLRVMSITFSYVDGAATLNSLYADKGLPAYGHLLYSRLGDLFVEKQRYQDAADTYRAYVQREPRSEFSPGLAMQAIEAYRKGGFGQLVLDGKREYIERYNFASAFWQGRERARYPTVVAELKTNMKDVATYFHATAQKSKKLSDYQVAARWYRDYLQSFPDDPESASTNYLLAETLFESQQFREAAAEYDRTAYGYPRNDRSAAAAYAGLVSYGKHEEQLRGEPRAAWHLQAIDAGIKFAAAFAEHPDSGGVITRAAQDVFKLNDLPRAIEVAQLVLAHQPQVDAAKQRIAWTIIAQSNFDLGQYDKAEAGYLRARDLLPQGDALRQDLTERLAASVYRQAEAKQKSGDSAGAVDDFLRVAVVAPDSPIRATAEFDAAAQLINLKLWDRAIGVLEAFRRAYPKSDLQPDVTRKLAVAYTEAGRAGDAALEFERITLSPREDAVLRREANLSAADLFEKSGNVGKTTAMLERFVSEYPTPVPEAVEARQRLADLAAKGGNKTRQEYWFKEIVKADATAGQARTDRTRYLAAKAQLVLATAPRDAFRAIKLVAPLKRSLETKRRALDVALKAYNSAVEYRITEVTTSATCEIAELYRTLGRDLMQSERPKKLDKDAREQYDLLLEEQAFPFEEQAIATHEINVQRVRDGVYDEGVRRSYQALAEMKPARYGKTEMALDPAAAAAAVSGPAALDVAESVARRDAGDLELAEQLLAQVAAGTSANAAVWSELGHVRRMRGKFALALEAYDAALALDPAYVAALRNRAVLHDLYLNDPAPALAGLERYQELTREEKPVSSWIAELRQRVAKLTPAAPPAGAPAPNPSNTTPLTDALGGAQ